MLDFSDLSYQFFSFTFEGLWAVVARIVLAGLVALIFWAASRFIKHRLYPRLIDRFEKRNWRVVTMLAKGFAQPLPVLVWCAGVYLALCTLPWGGVAANATRLFTMAFRLIVIILISKGLWDSSDLCAILLAGVQSRMELSTNQTLNRFLSRLYQALVAVFACITVMNELGFNVTGLITGVGLAGLTVSLAAQDSASNLFSGLVILMEHPFVIGDWIAVGDVEGTVEDISFRSTKIRALDNSVYVLPNSSVSNATVNNGTSRTKRLFRFTLGVTYTATRPQLEHLIADLDALLRAHPDVYTDSVTVKLTGFGDSSIDILISCYIKTADLGKFLAIQNGLNLDIMDVMAKNGTQFAFPSTSVYLEKSDSAQS